MLKTDVTTVRCDHSSSAFLLFCVWESRSCFVLRSLDFLCFFFCVIHYDPLWHKSCIYRIYIHVSADMNTQIASSIFLPHFSMLLCLVDGFIDLVFVKGLRGPTGMVCVVRKTSADHAVPCCFHHLRANKWKQQRSKSSTFNFWVSKNYWDVLTFLNKRGLDYVRKGSSLLPKLKLSDSS